jgi:flagellar motor switch protein FliG
MLAPALRKAAVLISALDRDAADALLEQMPEDQASQVRNAVMELPDIGGEEQDQVLREFFSGQTPQQASQPANDGGVELQLGQHHYDTSIADSRQAGHADSVHTAPLQPNNSGPNNSGRYGSGLPGGMYQDPSLAGTRAATMHTSGNDPTAPMFEYLKKATPDTLSRLLKTEHPQVTAVVISRLPPEKAAAIIETFDDQLQVDVLHRVAAIGEADPDAMRQLDRELSAILTKIDPALQLHDPGVQAVAAILNATSQKRQILERLQTRNSPLIPRVGGVEWTPNVNEPSRNEPSDTHDPPQPSSDSLEQTPLPASDGSISSGSVSVNGVSAAETNSISTQAGGSSGVSDEMSRPTAPIRHLTFDDVTRLPDADLAILLRTASPQVVLLSLLGAEPVFVNRLMRQLPPADARRFRERFNQTTPLSLADIDEAQRRLADLAAELITAGRIQKTRTQFAAAA